MAKVKAKGKHFSKGKAPIHLIPSEAITAMAHGFGFGAAKYGEYNFRYGIEWTELTDSLMRHTLAFLKGEDDDPESGLPHVWHIGNNFAMLEYMRVHHPELDNRFKNEAKSKKAKPRRKSSSVRNKRRKRP